VISSTCGLGVGGLAFFLVLLDLGRDVGRTALASGFYSGVYELQARAILSGRIAVPDGSMGIEGFIQGDQEFMYFPPFPALLRLPVLMTTHEFDGRLTLLSMAVAWVVFAVMVTKLAWLVLARVTGTEEVTRAGALLVGIFLACASGGTFLTYDASLPWVYHEVYLWAVASAVGALYWMTRVLISPDWHSARWLGGFAFAAIGTRATEGWAICLVVLGIALWMRWRAASTAHRLTWTGVLAAALVPLASSIALNMYKFGHPLLFPLEDQVWTSLNEHRQEALAANGGGLTGGQFFTTSFMAYLRPDGIRFVDYFPWVTLPAEPAQSYGGAFVDQAYRTGSATSFMTLLLLLTIISAVVLASPKVAPGARVLRVPLVASVLITGGVMAYGYYATRYTSEFVPALVLGGAIGTAQLVRLVGRARRAWIPVACLMAAMTAFAILAQVSIGLSAAAYQARGETLERYLGWQSSLSPESQAELVTATDSLPEGGRTDQLAVRGACDALYLNSGDRYEPWIAVQERDVSLRISPEGELRDGRVTLFEIPQTDESVSLVVDEDDQELRVVLEAPDGESGGAWLSFPPEGFVQLSVRNLTGFGAYEVSVTPSGVVGYLHSTHTDDDWVTHPAQVEVRTDQAASARRLGLEIDQTDTLALPLCHDLAATAGLALPGA
jgi:hypothetical protein